jgi:hypothetical protein
MLRSPGPLIRSVNGMKRAETSKRRGSASAGSIARYANGLL